MLQPASLSAATSRAVGMPPRTSPCLATLGVLSLSYACSNSAARTVHPYLADAVQVALNLLRVVQRRHAVHEPAAICADQAQLHAGIVVGERRPPPLPRGQPHCVYRFGRRGLPLLQGGPGGREQRCASGGGGTQRAALPDARGQSMLQQGSQCYSVPALETHWPADLFRVISPALVHVRPSGVPTGAPWRFPRSASARVGCPPGVCPRPAPAVRRRA